MIKNTQKINKRFLFFLLSQNEVQDWIVSNSTGSANQANISNAQIESLPLLLPPLHEQQAIAEVLGALDDKIEHNRRTNQTLEAMARALFRDWFVDFGPTRAKMDGQPPYLAPDLWALFPDALNDEGLPEGWELRPLDSIAEFLNGLALQKYPGTGNEDLPVIKIAELRSGITAKTGRASRGIPIQYLIRDGDVLFSWSGSLLQKIWTSGEGALNQHLFKVSSRQDPKWLHYWWVDFHLPTFQAIAASKATTMGHIKRNHLTDAKTNIGTPEMMDKANSTFAPMLDKQIQLEIENNQLAALRDYLLPKLVSGEVRVRDAEKAVGEVI